MYFPIFFCSSHVVSTHIIFSNGFPFTSRVVEHTETRENYNRHFQRLIPFFPFLTLINRASCIYELNHFSRSNRYKVLFHFWFLEMKFSMVFGINFHLFVVYVDLSPGMGWLGGNFFSFYTVI